MKSYIKKGGIKMNETILKVKNLKKKENHLI
jgi:hypothetical protein